MPYRLAALSIFAILISCSGVQTSRDTPRYLTGGATRELARKIIPIIRVYTAEVIVQVDQRPNGTVQVTTGSAAPYHSGRYFDLRKVRGVWRVTSDGIWNS